MIPALRAPTGETARIIASCPNSWRHKFGGAVLAQFTQPTLPLPRVLQPTRDVQVDLLFFHKGINVRLHREEVGRWRLS